MVRIGGNLKHIGRGVRLLEDTLIVVLVLAMILLAASQIILRNLWGMGLVWADPLLRVMVLWVGLLGAMAATRRNNHITVDVLSRYLPLHIKRGVQRITGMFAMLVCLVLSWHGVRFVLMEYEAGAEVFSGVPAWWCELIIPLGFAVMAARFALVTIAPPPEPV